MAIIGIDFGTIKSLVAIMENGVPKIIPDFKGRQYVPSLVTVGPDDKMYIGWDALELPPVERWGSKHFTISSIKRMLGKAGERTWGKYRTYPQEIASLIISQLKIQAEAYCGEEITRAVLAVPAHFSINERSATREAARVAGLSVERIIHEPTAAALAYGMASGKSSKIAVFDLGGGTFDISILEIGDNVFEVLASGGDTRLGGVDLNEALLAHVIGEFKQETGIDLKQVVSAQGRLEEAVEQAKCELSFVQEVPIKLPYIVPDSYGPKGLDMLITREKFEEIAEPIFDRLGGPCRQVLSDAKLAVGDLQEVILVGASTRIPRVRKIVKSIFGVEPGKSVNPDEVVALGAAVQGSILTGQAREDMVLLDVTPASLGVAMQGGVMNRLIERNTTIPTHKSESFSTTSDNQTEVTIPILQGERELAKDNTLLGNVELTGIPPAPKESTQIDVSFSIDANGILEVSAKHTATKREVSSRFLAGPYSLNPAQIKVLRRKVDGVLESSRQRMLQHRARLLDEEMRREAKAFATVLRRFLSRHADSMPGEHMSLLRAGVELVETYIERGSSREDMDKLIVSIRSTCQDTIRDSLRAVVGDLSAFNEFVCWKTQALASITTPALLDASFHAFHRIFSREIQVVSELLNIEDVLLKRDVTRSLFQYPIRWTEEKMVLAMIVGCCAGLEITVEGIAASEDHVLARTTPFFMLSKSPSKSVRASAAREIHSLRMDDCFFLLRYLDREPTSDSDLWLVKCLNELPEGVWVSRFINSDSIEEKEFKDSAVALSAIRRDAVWLMRADRGSWDTPLTVLEEVGPGDATETLVSFVLDIDHRDRPDEWTRLVSLLGSLSPSERLIPVLMEALAEGEESVSQAAMESLRKNSACLAQAVACIFASPSNAAGQLNAIYALRELGMPDYLGDIEALLCCGCHEDVLMLLIEIITDKTDKPAITPLMEVLGHSNSRVRHKALNALRPHRDRMRHPIRKIFTIAEKVLAEGEKASFWERRFLAKMMRVRDDLVELLALLRRRN